MIRTCYTLFFGLFLLATSFIQGQSVSGLVSDDEGNPLSGSYVSHPRSGHHVHTDIKGGFTIDGVAVGDSLLISYIGYETEKLVLNQLDKKLDIVLSFKVNLLGEVKIIPERDISEVINQVDLKINPVSNAQLILRKVPGLFIAQHAGGGKAEQIFLRGFDIDHGTDVSIQIDGMPVNMVSHAHGQGYADMHFIIPETIDRLDFNKGGYETSVGNFSTAGSIAISTKRSLTNNSIKLEGGQFDKRRALGQFKIINKKDIKAYVAAEHITSDGPFESPQRFHRSNVLFRLAHQISPDEELDIILSHFGSRWDASGQIPQRAIDNGLITRWGAIDDTEGGKTSRSNIGISHTKRLNAKSSIHSNISYSRYEFDLYSNFTFFLNDSVNGDQIRQTEGRDILNLTSRYLRDIKFGNINSSLELGASWRADFIDDSALSRTANRDSIISRVSFGDINESNIGAFASWRFNFGRLNITPGLRYDLLEFGYQDALTSAYDPNSLSKSAFSPKINFDFLYSESLKFYLKAGQSFHSNDSRTTLTAQVDEILPQSTGGDLGIVWKPMDKVYIQGALWYLSLEQEFVYVGDEGVVEPSGESIRNGFDFSIRYELAPKLIFDLDATYSDGRFSDEEEDQDNIPLAPNWTGSAGLSYQGGNGLYGSLRTRYLGDRPANEDYSITAEGYFLADLNIGYKVKAFRVFLRAENLLDTEWKEAQFATLSRLQDEPAEGIEEIHFTPGSPRAIFGGIEFNF